MVHPLQWLGRQLATFLAKPRAADRRFGTSGFGLLEASLQKGDVLLIEGSSRFSSVIKYLTQSSWSHAALYIGDTLSDRQAELGHHVLIEADVNDGVRVVSLETYRGTHTRICRAVGLAPSEVDAVMKHAIDRLGQRYDMRDVIDLLRYFMPLIPVTAHWRRRMLGLASGAPTQAICSSLIAAAFQSVHYPILPTIDRSYRHLPGAHAARKEILHIRSSRLFTPRDFDISPYFRIVKPMLEHHFDPHRIRWVRSEPSPPRPLPQLDASSPPGID